MRIKFKRKRNFDKLKQWHYWFAWRPVIIDNYIVWLETVKERISPISHEDDCLICWDYDFIDEEIIKPKSLL